MTTVDSQTDPNYRSDAHRAAVPTLVTIAAIIGLIGCAGFISTIFVLDGGPIREAVISPLTVVSNILVTVGFVLLTGALPLLSTRLRAPIWVSIMTSVAAACVAAVAWGTASVTVHFATIGADLETLTPWVFAFQSLPALPAAVGFCALGIAILRHRTAARGAAILLIVAGVVYLAPQYPPGSVLATIGLIWTSLTIEQNPTNPRPT